MTDLPTTPAALSLLLRRIEVHARKLADADRRVFEQRPESVRGAVKELVSCLYLEPPKWDKHVGLMQRVVCLLSPEVGRVLIDQGAAVAHRVVCPDNEDYTTPEPDAGGDVT